MKNKINNQIEKMREELYKISQYIGKNPELGHEEFKASKILTEMLVNNGFNVEMGTSGLSTAFEAVYDSGLNGPSLAFMAEYDALPEIGHACGHNLIGTMSIAAAVALSRAVKEYGGKIYVYGTPAEETRGGKVTMVDEGLFNHLDVAMMVHPAECHQRSGSSLAMDAIQFEFFGKPAHAAASPHEGINALDAVIQTFNGINALRQHLTSDVRIHGIIPEGGKAANIVPDYAVAQFYVRAKQRHYLNETLEKVKRCARGASLATGARLKTSFYELSYDNMITNQTLSLAFTENLVMLGIDPNKIHDENSGSGSIDMGNVSQVVPSIHPYIQISDKPCPAHTNEFREAAMSEQGFEGLIVGAKCLANTALDVLEKPELLKSIKDEFMEKKPKK